MFVESKAVAERWFHNGPYLYKVPECLERRKYLQTALEIRSSFKGRDLIEALRSLKEEFQDQPLPDNCREVVKSIVIGLSGSEVGGEFKPIMLPDTEFVLRETAELYHNDMPWATVDDDYTYVHRIVPLEIAVSLGVKLCRTASLEQYTDSDSEFTTMEFGQHEELTKRIQNIIRDYPFDVTILKELLQNADDAKATKMHIILDMRTHSSEHLISEAWTDLQGPALLVWNDSVFTENDLKGIQRLGLGSKRSDSETIGQYGIGFNAVYHLTDCPSFLTGGKHFCILDPHRRYVQQATVKHPGVMYKDLDEKFWKKFDGLKQPYLRGGVKNLPEELQGGTLFRFPLRHSLHHVLKSSITKDMCHADKKVVSAHRMSELLEEWAPNMKQALLFLNNVVELKFSIIKDFRREGIFHLQNEYRAELDETAHKRRLEFTQSVKKYDEPSTTRDPYITTYQLTIVEPAIKKVKEKREEWLIQKGIGDMEDRDKQWAPVEFVKPKHGIATLLKNAKDLPGQLYCFLPLPIHTSLPVHINGQFILNSTRRNLWVATDHQRGDDKFHWNKDLLDAIASSYALFLERIQEYFPDLEGYSTRQAFEFSVGDYYACFPRIKKVENGEELSGRWLELIKQVFKVLCKRNSPILAVPSNISPKASEDKYVLQWKQLKSEQMPVSQVYFGSTIDHASQQISIFERIGMKITCAPMWVMRHLKDAQCEVPVISKSTVYQFYTQFHTTCVSSKYPCPIQETPFKCVEDFKKFTEYLLTETPSAFLSFSFAKQYQFPREPFGYPLLLNAAEDLTIFNKADKILCSKFSQLFPKCPYKFLHPKLIDCHYLPSYFVTANEQKESVKIVKEVLETVLPAELKNSCVSPESDLLTKFDIREMWVCFSTDVVFKTAIEEVLKVWALLLTKDKRLFRRTSSEQLLPMIESTSTTSRRAISLYHSQDSVMSVLEDTLRMPILDTSIVSESAINSLCPKVSDEKATLQNLYYLHREFPIESLTINGAGTLLRYFAKLNLKQDSGCCQQLSCLPLFEKMDGKLTALEGKSVYVWPTGICQEGNEQWLMGMNVVFLKPNGVWTQLRVNEELGIQKITAEETYMNFIFPNFFKMNKKYRYCHLMYIRDNLFDQNYVMSRNRYSPFVLKLKELPCIGEDGTPLKLVRHFHTDQTEIFLTFPKHFNTIPEDLVRQKKSRWMPFLKKLGLQETVSQDTFLTLCEYVAGGKMKEKTVHGSKVLMNYLFSAYENTQHQFQNDSYYLQRVSKISFVCPVPVPECEWIHKPPATSNRVVLPDKTEVTLCMLYGSCLEKHKHLLWSIRPVVHLPEESQISHVCNSLGICMMPSAKDLMDVIKLIAKTRFTDSKLFDKYTAPQCKPNQQQMMDVMTNIFVHLENSKHDLKQLRSLRCIPVYALSEEEMGQLPVLVEPTRVIFRPVQETKAFYPYLHSVSNMLYKAKEFLERIGVQDSIELEHMQMVLESVFKASESGAVELEPNTFKVVTEAIVTISRLLEKNKKEKQQVLAEKLSPLYLPSTGRQMQPVDCLVYSQIRDVNLEGTGLYKLWTPFERDVFPSKFCELLPKALRPKALSMLCFKKLSESCKECETKPEISDVIEKSLNFSNLQQALVLAVKAAVSAGNYPDRDKLCSKFDEHTSEFFESLKIVYVDRLKIEYYLKDSDVSRPVASACVDSRIQREEQELCLYIESKLYHLRVTKVHETIAHHLLLCINDLRESDVQNLKMLLVELLGSPSPEHIHTILHTKQIHYTEEDASSGDPRLGERVPKSLYDRLDMSNQNIFQAQEWVAYEEDEADIYIFAEVSRPVKLRDETGQPLSPMEMEYIIFTSESDTTGKKVKSVDLFKFKRGKTAPEDSILPPLSESQEIVLYEGNEEEKPIPTAPVNVQEARQEVNAELDEIWRLPADQRKKAIRRLLLKWHPDKNLNFPDLAEDVFKYIQQELDRRERGDGVSMSNDSGPYQSWRRHQKTWESHASQHKTYQQRSKKRRRGGRGGGGGGGGEGGGGGGGWGSFNRQDFFSNPSFTPPKSEPKSKVWVRQAVADHSALQVLLNESQHNPHLYCHVCFMSHEVAEKALKGAMYGTCGLGEKLHKSHNVIPLAFAVEQAEPEKGRGLGDLADNLETKHVYIDTRFPDDQPSKAPYENFTLEGATEAEKCATGILKIVRAIIEVDM